MPAHRPVFDLVGNTPLVPLHFAEEKITIHAKCEFLNPSGSIKDRLARHVLLDAEARGLLRPDSIILECTSGNTGIALSMAGTAMGLRVCILNHSCFLQMHDAIVFANALFATRVAFLN